jgi:acetyl esterase/lipase
MRVADSRYIPKDLEQIPDIRFTEESEHELLLDLFRLRGVNYELPQPLVMWIHGGGWMSGDKDRGVERVFDLVRMGFLAASVNYRLSDEARFPAQLHDCKCAVRFLRAHARDYNIDGDRIGVWGASSGGHLASMLAVTGHEQSFDGDGGWSGVPSHIQAACSWFGPSDLNLMDRFPTGVTPRLPSMGADSAEGRLLGGPVAEKQELVALANPIRYVHADCPPMLLMHGAQDDAVPLASSEALYKALVEKGVEAHLHVIRTGHHNAYLWGDHHIRMVSEFFDWHLRRGNARGQ